MADFHLPQLPIQSLRPWAALNGITLNDIEIKIIPGRGNGLLAKRDLTTTTEDEASTTLLNVPRDLVLSAETVEQYAKEDRDFKQLLDIAGGESTRGDILLFLLVQVAIAHHGDAKQCGLSTPWTTYLRFLPSQISLPTLWTKKERSLLQGTSLEASFPLL